MANVRRIDVDFLLGSAEMIEVRIGNGREARTKVGGGSGTQTAVNDSLI